MKKYLFKMIPLTFTFFMSFFFTLYMLYLLYRSESPFAIRLSISIGISALCLLLMFFIHSKKNNNTSTDLPELHKPTEISEELSIEPSIETSSNESTDDSLSISKEVQNDIMDKNILFHNGQPLQEMDIIAAARDAMEGLTPFAEAQNIRLHLSTTNDTLMIMAEPESIRVLFRNIIDNSIKYMGRAGHMIITISLLGDDIFIILKDTGKGLSEDETTHVFELNFQGSNRVSGNGLGLTQTKMIVEAFGGTIYAKSSLENGMAIYIQLPVSGKSQND